LGKKIQRSSPHSAGNNHIGTQIVKPFWQHTRFMGWWDEGLRLFDLVAFDIDQCKFLTMSKVSREFSFR
jgi:hypothetical protein